MDALVKTQELSVPDTSIVALRTARKDLASLNADDALKLAIWADAVKIAARAKRAEDVAREASETVIRAHRRLGQLLSADAQLNLEISGAQRGAWKAVAAVPHDLFERTIEDLLHRGLSCSPSSLLAAAHRLSLEKVEGGIWIAWDGAYFIEGFGTTRRRRSDHQRIEDVREEVRNRNRLRERKTPKQLALDDAHAQARRAAQSLSILRGDFRGEVARLIADAELQQAKVASLLFDAYRMASTR